MSKKIINNNYSLVLRLISMGYKLRHVKSNAIISRDCKTKRSLKLTDKFEVIGHINSVVERSI